MPENKLNIVISGATGLVGSALFKHLSAKGHKVRRLVRRRPRSDTRQEIYWNPASGFIETSALEGTDVLIHLSGKNIAKKYWSKKQKNALIESRVKSTELLSHSLTRLKKPPHLFICASAIGFYGNRDDEDINENSKPGLGFLADLCKKWEDATVKAQQLGIPVINLRSGVVLSSKGGLLKRMLPSFRLGLGSMVGSGKQFMSWISLVDMVSAIEHLMTTPGLEGPFNMATEHPVTHEYFCHTLAETLKRPCAISIPDAVAKFIFGQKATELILASCKAAPDKLLKSGYIFKEPYLEGTLNSILKK